MTSDKIALGSCLSLTWPLTLDADPASTRDRPSHTTDPSHLAASIAALVCFDSLRKPSHSSVRASTISNSYQTIAELIFTYH